MKRFKASLVTILLFICTLYANGQNSDFAKYVNPFIGTDFTGHTFPGAAYPFGMIQLSPDTGLKGWEVCSGYHYSHKTMYGFSHTHLNGTGCEDLCDVLIMPVFGWKNTEQLNGEEYKASFSHNNEKASAGFYSVKLDNGIEAQLTVGKRTGIHNYTFPKGKTPQIILDLVHRGDLIDKSIKTVKNNIGDEIIGIEGFRRVNQWAADKHVYFYIQFSAPLKPLILGNKQALLTFNTNSNNIYAAVGISSVSTENAKNNMLTEIAKFNKSIKNGEEFIGKNKKDWQKVFNGIHSSTKEEWNKYLGKIDITQPSNSITAADTSKTVFYTAMYHTAIAPCLYSDYNGEYRGMDGKIHKAEDFERYTVFSLWDTYRALHPLFSLIERERTVDFLKTFISIFKECNKLPVWELWANETNCMIGFHSASVIADALVKGITPDNYSRLTQNNIKELFNAMIESSNKKEAGINYNNEDGFVRGEKEHESVSKTLEYAYDNWCIGVVAKMLGYTDLSKEYFKRAQYYKNVFNPDTHFMTPVINGCYMDGFNPREVNYHFTEGNSWQYSFYAPQDINTLINMHGGDKDFNLKLDSLFSASTQTTGKQQVDITGLIGQYAHGNEPSHHAAYLYNFSGEAWKTQELVNKILTTLYSYTPDGLCGNDDCGQMSAWYVLSSLGFYPVTPGTDEFIIGSPLYPKVVINFEDGTKTTISKSSNSKGFYVNDITVNGRKHSKSYFKLNDILGSDIVFSMSSQPNKMFGTKKEDRPATKITEVEDIVLSPVFYRSAKDFKDSLIIYVRGAERAIMNDGKTEIEINNPNNPFTIYNKCTITAYSNDNTVSTTAKFNKIKDDLSIELFTEPDPYYFPNGKDGMIDGITGTVQWRLGHWHGYRGNNFEGIVDMQKDSLVSVLSMDFLQDIGNWIWFPTEVEYSISKDGIEFTPAGIVKNDISQKETTVMTKEFILNLPEKTKCRYIKIIARNLGIIPEWHAGAGKKGYMFTDEINIK